MITNDPHSKSQQRNLQINHIQREGRRKRASVVYLILFGEDEEKKEFVQTPELCSQKRFPVRT